MLKIKDNVDLKELEKYGFEVFYSDISKCLFAVKDILKPTSNFNVARYRIGVDEKNRIFRKSKFRPGKFLLQVKVTKNDIDDLIKDDLVEKVKE